MLSSPLDSPLSLQIRAQAATILGSLAQSASTSRSILHSLLHEPVVPALLDSLAQVAAAADLLRPPGTDLAAAGPGTPDDGTGSGSSVPNVDAIKAVEALLRALKALYLSASGFVAPSARWGLGSGQGFVKQGGGGGGGASSSVRSATAMGAGKSPMLMDVDSTELRRSSFHSMRSRYGLLAGMAGGSKPDGASTGSSTPVAFAAGGRLGGLSGHATPASSTATLGEVEDGTLRMLIRAAIAALYTEARVHLLLSCLFLSRLFDREHEESRYTARASTSAAAATGSSAAAQTASSYSRSAFAGGRPKARQTSISSAMSVDPCVSSMRKQGSAMSLASEHGGGGGGKARRSAAAAGGEAEAGVASRLTQMDAALLTGVAEMVCLILSSTLMVPSAARSSDLTIDQIYGLGRAVPAASADASTADAATPAAEIYARRNLILAFSEEQHSAFKLAQLERAENTQGEKARAGAEDAMDDDDDARGRAATSSAQESTPRGLVVLRSKSRKRGREEEGTALERLLFLIECSSGKAQEAALWATADLVRDHSQASLRFFRCQTPSGTLPTTLLMQLKGDRVPAVRLAAFCALASIIKVHPFTPRTNGFVLAELVQLLSLHDDAATQAQACFAIARLVSDDGELQLMACKELDALPKLAAILQSTATQALVQRDPAASRRHAGPAVDEQAIRLCEGALTALAALTYEKDSIRRSLVDIASPAVLPLVMRSLHAAALGVRVAACRLVRSLSRSVSILRTSLVDAGAADWLVAFLKDDSETGIVKSEAIATICNLALKFSPMKKLLIESGGLARLVAYAKHDQSEAIRLNALWALKNVLFSSDTETKAVVAEALSFAFLAALIEEKNPAVQEQALNIVRNLASSREADLDLTLKGFGEERLFSLLEKVIWDRGEASAVEHAAYILVNIASGSEAHRMAIIKRPNILDALLSFLDHPSERVRDAGVWCALNLSFTSVEARKAAAGAPSCESGHATLLCNARFVRLADVSCPLTVTAVEAVKRLRSFGFQDRLSSLATLEEVRDVRARAQVCLDAFEMIA